VPRANADCGYYILYEIPTVIPNWWNIGDQGIPLKKHRKPGILRGFLYLGIFMEFYWYSGNFKKQFFVTLVIKIVCYNSNTKTLVEYESLGCLPSRKT